ncbi:sulfotransferase domain-containing protein [Amaricoccus tamworthensis]|uniref:sulfotransferase domain-containing protein n=1 Tax=Amaricoccus tamworthensis TaxID=57002 RepID=UPI003C7AFE43
MTQRPWLPNLIIAGAPKAGTSSLYRWIADHPDAFGSTEKETYFFVDPGTHMYRPNFHISNGLDSYQAQFPIPAGSSPKVVLESTPGYMYSRTALEHIADLPSKPRCLFVLREPASQIYSLYSYFRGNWDWIPSDMDFGDFVKTVRSGSHSFKGNELAVNALSYARYIEYLVPWWERLGADRMKIILFDDLKADEMATTRLISNWLELDPDFYDDYEFGRDNETYIPRNALIQKINIAGRNLLPKGRVYETLRSLYRRANTRKPDGPTETERAVIADLRSEFSSANGKLAEFFKLDVSSWA